MEKKKSVMSKILPILLAAVVCVCTAAGFCTLNYLQGKTVSMVNDNGETILTYDQKANIVENIIDDEGKLVILEIVPFENAGVMDMLVGTEKVRNKLEEDKQTLYNTFKYDSSTYGTVTAAKVSGKIANFHPFTIEYDSSTKEYTVNYPNSFLNTLVDAATYPAMYNYLMDNIEVRTVVAGEMTAADLEGVSLIYVSSYLENAEVVSFNRYINGEVSASQLTSGTLDNADSGAYRKNGSNYTAIKTSASTSAWYDCYVKADNGSYVSSDMEWDMVKKIVNFVYAGNEYTDGQPIPCIINYGNPVNKTTNVFKLITLLMKTTNETESVFNDMPTYYRTIMNAISESSEPNSNGRTTGVFNYGGTAYTDWSNTGVPLFNLASTTSAEYTFNFAYKTSNNGSDSVFGMGSINNTTLTDAGSAYLRGLVGEDTDKYTSSDVIGYLLGFEGAGEKKVVRVLEIEPCRDFLYDYSAATTDATKKEVFNNIQTLGKALNIPEYSSVNMKNYSAYENLANKRISFKCVSTAEFNGMNEDLVAYYDIIIMGSEYGTMCTDSSGNTIYNDTSLDGYIYLAYGDIVKADDRSMGTLPTDYLCIDSYVNSNKIVLNGYTLDKSFNLQTTAWKDKKYIYSMHNPDVWSPMLQNSLGGSFYVLKSVNSTFSGVTNPTTYYGNSLGNARLSGNDITNRKLEELLEFVNIGRPVIMADNLYTCVSAGNKTAYPTSKVYSFVEQKAENTNVIAVSNIPDDLMGIMHGNTLKITNHSIMYSKNGVMTPAPEITYGTDGLLSENCVVEGVDQFTYSVDFKATPGKEYYVKLIIDKNTDGRFNSEATVDDFNEVYYAKIVRAETNQISTKFDVQLAQNYNGMFAWQILIEELDSRRTVVDAVSEEGYTVVRGESKPVKVLQLLPASECNLNLLTNNKFKTLIQSSSGRINYDIDIDTILIDDFEKQFVRNPYTRGESYKTDADYLNTNNYTMLVIGFSDSYSKQDLSDDYGALSCVVDFIENGNSVLFSHDTMEFQPSANAGITGSVSNSGKNKGKFNISTTSEWNERANYPLTIALRNRVGMDRYNTLEITNLNDESQLIESNIPKNANGEYITEIQGFSNWFLSWMTNCTKFSTTRPRSGLYNLVPAKGMESYLASGGTSTQCTTTTVSESNKGQITMYPYETTEDDGTLKIAVTHAQYYQLDLEDEEVVVWYTLTNTDSNSGRFYGQTYGDAANNYYIYSKGNITYSGAGHSAMSQESELKLFVNTIIRAAVAGNFAPEITVINGSSTRQADTFVVFPNSMDNRITVQFKAFDEDLATRSVVENTYTTEAEILDHIGRFQNGAVYWVSPEGERKPLKQYSRTGTYLLNNEPTSIQIYDPFEGLEGTALTNAYNNASQLNKNMHDCYQEYVATGLTELRIEASDYQGATGFSTVKIIKHELFPLD